MIRMTNERSVVGAKALQGFTLIELMITVAILAIVSAIAYPSYTESVRRGNRAEVQALLLEAQQFMERYYAANDQYTNSGLPARLRAVPLTAPRYNLTVTATVSSYTLTAVPAGSMAVDKCGSLSITNLGVKGRSASGPSIQDCWR